VLSNSVDVHSIPQPELQHNKHKPRVQCGEPVHLPAGTKLYCLEMEAISHIKGVMCLVSLCMRAMAGRTAGPIKTKLGIGTHVDPGSVLVKVKVKVIYVCVRYNRFMPAPPGE